MMKLLEILHINVYKNEMNIFQMKKFEDTPLHYDFFWSQFDWVKQADNIASVQ